MQFFEDRRRNTVERAIRNDNLWPRQLNETDVYITTDSGSVFAPKVHSSWNSRFQDLTQLLKDSFGEDNSIQRTIIEGSQKRGELISPLFSFDVSREVIFFGYDVFLPIASSNYFMKLMQDEGGGFEELEDGLTHLDYQIGTLKIETEFAVYGFYSSLERPQRFELRRNK